MAVEAAVGQIGGFHDVGDADAAESLGAEQRAGRIDDALAVLRRPFPGSLSSGTSAMRATSGA